MKIPTIEQLKYLGAKLEELQNEASDQIIIALNLIKEWEKIRGK